MGGWLAGWQADRPCLAGAVDTHSALMHSSPQIRLGAPSHSEPLDTAQRDVFRTIACEERGGRGV